MQVGQTEANCGKLKQTGENFLLLSGSKLNHFFVSHLQPFKTLEFASERFGAYQATRNYYFKSLIQKRRVAQFLWSTRYLCYEVKVFVYTPVTNVPCICDDPIGMPLIAWQKWVEWYADIP